MEVQLVKEVLVAVLFFEPVLLDVDLLSLLRLQMVDYGRGDVDVGFADVLEVALEIGHHHHLDLECAHLLIRLLEDESAGLFDAYFLFENETLLCADHYVANRLAWNRADALLLGGVSLLIPIEIEASQNHVAIVELGCFGSALEHDASEVDHAAVVELRLARSDLKHGLVLECQHAGDIYAFIMQERIKVLYFVIFLHFLLFVDVKHVAERINELQTGFPCFFVLLGRVVMY